MLFYFPSFRFFLQEIQAGEALISSGDIEQGVTHLANAVVVCGQPTQLLQVSFMTFINESKQKKQKNLINFICHLLGASTNFAITSVHPAYSTNERVWQ